MFFEDSASSVSSSKRFFDLIKPLYNKTAKKQSINSVCTSPASSPAAARQRSNIPSGIRTTWEEPVGVCGCRRDISGEESRRVFTGATRWDSKCHSPLQEIVSRVRIIHVIAIYQ
ncbi:hypothetical protein Bca52824_043672 [Brassica carinata]|uniref:Uncharacterized protein n=1 Tax=Brassica carinata TaxID=52824 RepID=A0A8X7S0K4_BRACI|nr:hypothetical protein Bca52824_043672 [Brassica carinata]